MEYKYPSVSEYFIQIGSPTPPGNQITQEAFDYSQEPLIFLSESRIGKEYHGRVDWALSEYNYDLMYVRPLQQNLMRHWLPICMEYWQKSLFAQKGYSFTNFFHDTLCRHKNIIAETVGIEVQDITFQFMRDTILALLNSQSYLCDLSLSSTAYKWIPRFNAFVSISNDLEYFLLAWEKMNSYGFAISYFQYISCLAFEDSKNPVFNQQRPHKITYSPDLSEIESLNDMCYWSERNIKSYEEWFSVNNVKKIIYKAITHFPDNSREAFVALEIEQAILKDPDAFEFNVLEVTEVLKKKF